MLSFWWWWWWWWLQSLLLSLPLSCARGSASFGFCCCCCGAWLLVVGDCWLLAAGPLILGCRLCCRWSIVVRDVVLLVHSKRSPFVSLCLFAFLFRLFSLPPSLSLAIPSFSALVSTKRSSRKHQQKPPSNRKH